MALIPAGRGNTMAIQQPAAWKKPRQQVKLPKFGIRSLCKLILGKFDLLWKVAKASEKL